RASLQTGSRGLSGGGRPARSEAGSGHDGRRASAGSRRGERGRPQDGVRPQAEGIWAERQARSQTRRIGRCARERFRRPLGTAWSVTPKPATAEERRTRRFMKRLAIGVFVVALI